MNSLDIDLNEAREQLTDPDCGYVLFKNFLNKDEVVHYRQECADFLVNGPVHFARVNTDNMYDYVHPRSHDEIDRTWRIYQFLHNSRSSQTDAFLTRTLQFRDKLEEPWIDDLEYRREKERLQNYIIVTKYAPNAGMLPKHKDYEGDLKYPLLQFLILLSQPDHDYQGGEFHLYTQSGRRIGLQAELNVGEGDAVLFNKSLFHEVDETRPAPNSEIGRWTVLIGARAVIDTQMQAKRRLLATRLIRRPSIKRTFQLAKKAFKRSEEQLTGQDE